jgi:phenylacetate-CoA ligase
MISRAYDLLGLVTSTLLYPIAERMQKRRISPKLRVLRYEASLPFAERKSSAQRLLADCLEHAGRTVPYYRDLFASLGFDPAKTRADVRYLEELPYLTKEILREQGRRLLSEPYAGKIVREQKTGSSTGPAAVIYYDQESLDWTAAQNILMLEWAGKRRYNREAHLSTRFRTPLSPEAQRAEARKCFILNRYNIYTDGFGDVAQEHLIRDLLRAGAGVVQGHPSSLYALARCLKKQGRGGHGLFSLFVSTGEMITPKQRALIEEIFGARVSDRYGACEFGVMAQERKDGPKGELSVSDSLVWPETLPSGEDGIGELVFTNLRNRAMPLIRYRMGDLGKLQERADGWRITEMAGRTHDEVEIDGEVYPTHYLQDIFDRCGKIEDFQVTVKDGKAVEFRLAVAPEQWESVAYSVRAEFPDVPLRRIDLEDLVFVGVRGKFSYLLREAA